MAVREGRIFVKLAGQYPNYASDYRVQALEVGAQVTTGSAGSTIAVCAGHGFAAGDKWMRADGTGFSGVQTITSVDATHLYLPVSYSVSNNEIIVNLGPDTGVPTPNYDGNGLVVYLAMDYTQPATNATVQTDANGRFRYYHKGIARWELVRTSTSVFHALFTDTEAESATTPDTTTDNAVVRWDGTTGEALQNSVVTIGDTGATTGITTLNASGAVTLGSTLDVTTSIAAPTINGVRYMNEFATAGAGTSGSPWTGWESACVEGYTVRFPGGYYSVSTLPVPITTTNAPCLTSITGDGSGRSIITITGATGQFRVYGSGGGTRTIINCVIRGLRFQIGTNNTSTGIVSFENFDQGCLIDDVIVDPTASYKATVGAYFLNGEQFRIGSLAIRGWSATPAAVGNVGTGVKIYTDDGIQRGDMRFDFLYITNCTTGLMMSSSGGSIADTSFGLTKIVNSPLKDGTLGVSLASNVEQVTFGDLHVEAFNNGLQATAVENLFIGNGLFNIISNEAVSSGAAITVTNGDGGHIMTRINAVYNGVVFDGTTARMFYQATASGSITGTLFSDTASGANFYLTNGTIASNLTASGSLTSTGGLSLSTLGTILTIATGAVTVTKSNHQLDTEAAAASDDLDTINGGIDGGLLVLCCNNDARTVVVKNGTGNIKLNVAGDFSLDNSLDQLVLIKRNTNWIELTRSNNGA